MLIGTSRHTQIYAKSQDVIRQTVARGLQALTDTTTSEDICKKIKRGMGWNKKKLKLNKLNKPSVCWLYIYSIVDTRSMIIHVAILISFPSTPLDPWRDTLSSFYFCAIFDIYRFILSWYVKVKIIKVSEKITFQCYFRFAWHLAHFNTSVSPIFTFFFFWVPFVLFTREDLWSENKTMNIWQTCRPDL